MRRGSGIISTAIGGTVSPVHLPLEAMSRGTGVREISQPRYHFPRLRGGVYALGGVLVRVGFLSALLPPLRGQ